MFRFLVTISIGLLALSQLAKATSSEYDNFVESLDPNKPAEKKHDEYLEVFSDELVASNERTQNFDRLFESEERCDTGSQATASTRYEYKNFIKSLNSINPTEEQFNDYRKVFFNELIGSNNKRPKNLDRLAESCKNLFEKGCNLKTMIAFNTLITYARDKRDKASERFLKAYRLKFYSTNCQNGLAKEELLDHVEKNSFDLIDKMINLKNKVLKAGAIDSIADFNRKLSKKVMMKGSISYMKEKGIDLKTLSQSPEGRANIGYFFSIGVVWKCVEFLSGRGFVVDLMAYKLALEDQALHKYLDKEEKDWYFAGQICIKIKENGERVLDQLSSYVK